MMPPALPYQVVLQPGELSRALIQRDWRVQVLGDMLLAVLGLITTVVSLILLDLSLQRPLMGMRAGLVTTFAFLAGPLLVQRWVWAGPPYILTNQRLFLTEGDWVELRDIRRIRIWVTSITLQTEMRQIWMKHLINPAATALLIRETAAGKGPAQ